MSFLPQPCIPLNQDSNTFNTPIESLRKGEKIHACHRFCPLTFAFFLSLNETRIPLIKEVLKLLQVTESIHVAVSVQVHDGGPGPGDEGARRPEGPRLEDQQ